MFLKSLFHSPIGDIGLLADEENILSLSFTNQTFKGLKTKKSDERFKELSLQLNQYFFEGLILMYFCASRCLLEVRKRLRKLGGKIKPQERAQQLQELQREARAKIKEVIGALREFVFKALFFLFFKISHIQNFPILINI